MAAPGFVAAMLDRLSSLRDRIPFVPKKDEEDDEAFFHGAGDGGEIRAGSKKPASPNKPAKAAIHVDLSAIASDMATAAKSAVKKPSVIGILAALALFFVSLIVVSLIVNAPPGQAKGGTYGQPSTAEGRAAASRLLLPPDPALDLAPPMERDRHIPYTEDEARRFAPIHGANEAASIIGRNDRAMEAIFGAVP